MEQVNDEEINSKMNQCTIRLKYETFPLDYGYYLCGPVLASLITVGLLGNFFCLLILLKTRPMPVVSFYTIPLCICDCAVILGSFLMNSLPHLLYGRMKTYGPYVRLYPSINFFSNFAYTSCVWLVILLSIERYFALCHPLKHKIYDAKRRSFLISILCLIVAAIYTVPRYFEIRTFDCYELRARKMLSFLEPAEFRSSKSYWIVYKVVLGLTLFSLVPFLFLCYLSARMWLEVKKTRRLALRRELEIEIDISSQNGFLRKESTGRSLLQHETLCQIASESSRRSSRSRGHCGQSADKQRRVLSYTLLCVVLKFLVSHTLPAVIDLCETIMEKEQFQQPIMENLVDTSTLLVVANSSLNIFINAWCSGGFRKRIKTLLKPRNGTQSRNVNTRLLASINIGSANCVAH